MVPWRAFHLVLSSTKKLAFLVSIILMGILAKHEPTLYQNLSYSSQVALVSSLVGSLVCFFIMALMSYVVSESLIVLELSLDALAKLVTLVLRGLVAIGGSRGNGEVNVKTELEFNWQDDFGKGVVIWWESPWPV